MAHKDLKGLFLLYLRKKTVCCNVNSTETTAGQKTTDPCDSYRNLQAGDIKQDRRVARTTAVMAKAGQSP